MKCSQAPPPLNRAGRRPRIASRPPHHQSSPPAQGSEWSEVLPACLERNMLEGRTGSPPSWPPLPECPSFLKLTARKVQDGNRHKACHAVDCRVSRRALLRRSTKAAVWAPQRLLLHPRGRPARSLALSSAGPVLRHCGPVAHGRLGKEKSGAHGLLCSGQHRAELRSVPSPASWPSPPSCACACC